MWRHIRLCVSSFECTIILFLLTSSGMVCLVSFESSSAIIKHWNEAHRDIPQQSHFSEESLSFWEKLMDGTEVRFVYELSLDCFSYGS